MYICNEFFGAPSEKDLNKYWKGKKYEYDNNMNDDPTECIFCHISKSDDNN
jgi:hypothetical protein